MITVISIVAVIVLRILIRKAFPYDAKKDEATLKERIPIMRERGIISEEEYQRAKINILDKP